MLQRRFRIIASWCSRKQISKENEDMAPRCGGLNPCGWRMQGVKWWYKGLGIEGGSGTHNGHWRHALRSVKPP
nr:hypothetical protein CFP56_62355 [Quercus suber]